MPRNVTAAAAAAARSIPKNITRITITAMTIGKVIRYGLVIAGTLGVAALI